MVDQAKQQEEMAALAKQYLDMWQAQFNQATSAAETTQAWQQFTDTFQQMQHNIAAGLKGGAYGDDASATERQHDGADVSAHRDGGVPGAGADCARYDAEHQQLLQRIAWLEQRVAALEAKLAE